VLSAQTVEFDVDSDVGDSFLDMIAEGGPEPVLNCDAMYFVRPSVRMLFHCEVGNTLERAAAIRKAAKPLLMQAASSPGPIRDAIESGQLYGTEFDWHFYSGTQPDAATRLPLVGEFYGDDGSQTFSLLLARMYCYDQDQFEAREAIIYPPGIDRYLVWWDAPVATDPTGALGVFGEDNYVHGRAKTAGKLEVYGRGNKLVDGALYRLDAFVGGGAESVLLRQASTITIPSVLVDVDTLRAQAQACGGCYFADDANITGSFHPLPGLVFAEGDVYLSDSDMQAIYTLVSATGDITISGHSNELQGSSEFGLALAIAFEGEIKISGDKNHLVGENLALQAPVRVSGSQNLVHGLILGRSVVVTGSGNILTDGTHPHDPGPIP
jgi:hypothetical protein